MSDTVDLYNNVYTDFASRAEAAVRRAAFGEDIRQSSWLTATEWLRFADLAQVYADSHVLEVGSGSGGPAVYLATARGCKVTGVDINENGVRNGEQLAAARGLGDRVSFRTIDGSQPLPFPADTFDAVLSNDAMCHISNRAGVLANWHQVLKPKGRILFTDAMIITGLVSQEELAIRSSIGFYLFLPPGENERLITHAGFTMLATEDVTRSAEVVAQRWREAREAHRRELVKEKQTSPGCSASLLVCIGCQRSADSRDSRIWRRRPSKVRW